jgi:sugar lactone lactonase YvrE
MTFDPNTGRIWRADAFNQTISRIIPSTGVVDFSFTVPSSVLFQPVGIAFDGTDLYIGGFLNNRIEEFTTSGVDTGTGFTLGANFVGVGGSGSNAGGLAFDPTDGTLYIGTWNRVYHYETTGIQLGFFNTPAGANRFVDGLTFEGAPAVNGVPEPSTLTLFGIGIVGLLGCSARRRKQAGPRSPQT